MKLHYPFSKERGCMRLLYSSLIVASIVSAIAVLGVTNAYSNPETPVSAIDPSDTPADASRIYDPQFAMALRVPGILEALQNGTLRPTTTSDIDEWETSAKDAKRELDYYHPTYTVVLTVQRPFKLPSLLGSSVGITYFVAPGIPFPKGDVGGTNIYHTDSGDWATSGKYDNGAGIKTGIHPASKE